MLHGVLPSFGVLASRHSPVSPQCRICKLGFEDVQHCIFSCARAREVWHHLGLTTDINKAMAEDRSGSDTCEFLARLKGTSVEFPKAELIVVACWYIWWQRRQ